MKEQLIQEIQRKMLPYLNNEQLLQLGDALTEALQGVSVSYEDTTPKQEERDAVEAFITAKRIEGCSEKTLKYYRKTIESMLSSIAKKASQITTDDLRKYLTTYQTQRRSSKVTIDNIRRILSSFFSWLEDEDFILKSPVRRIHKVKTAKVVKDTYTDEALELMRDSCTTTRDLAIIDLLASSGMRVGEITGLRWCDIDLEEEVINVNHTLVYYCTRTEAGQIFAINTTKTKAGERTIPMLPIVKEAFLMEKEYQEECGIKSEAVVDGYRDFIFVNRFGNVQHQGTLNKALRRIIRDCNFEVLDKDHRDNAVILPKFSNHSLRHTFTTRMCEAGVNIKVMQDILGHADAETTMQIYAEATKDLKKSELINFDEYFAKQKKAQSGN